MSERKFKEGDIILVTKGMYKGMRGTVSCAFVGGDRVRYRVTFRSFKTDLYSYQMRLDTIESESEAIKRTVGAVESIGKVEKPKMWPGTHVILSKKGLAKIHVDGEIRTGHSYEWVCDNNFHTIRRVYPIDGINFYTLVGFADSYYFTDDDLVQITPGCGKGDKVQFTRETLVKLGVELSKYYGDDTINKLPQDIIGPREVLGICYQDDKVLYQLDGASFGKLFYAHEIEPYK